jgi:hypothetical protein
MSATSILTSYCAAKGYTSIINPTTLPSPTGASTVTVTAAVSTVTQHSYQTVYLSAGSASLLRLPGSQQIYRILIVLILLVRPMTGFST